MLRDLRDSWRLLRGNPAFSAIITLTLALGVGLTTAIFTVVYGVLLRPLPFSIPGTLVTGPSVTLSAWSAWRRDTHALEDIGLYDFGVEPLLFAGNETARIRQAEVSTNLLSILGVRPALGRDFQATDSEPGAEPVVMLTDTAWRQYFGAREDIVGTLAPFDPARRRVIGILPADFVFPMRTLASVGPVRMLTPISSRPSAGYPFRVVARLQNGASLTQARTEELAIIRRSASESSSPAPPDLVPLSESMLGASRDGLTMLLAAVGLLLLIACGNVANLLVAKGTDRRREFAVRLALGASRRDIARLVLVQSCTLSLLGGVLGVCLAYAAFDVLMALVSPQLPRAGEIAIDRHVLGFAFLVSFISGLALGAFPAWQLSRTDLQGSLHSYDRTTLPARRFRSILVAIEVAMAVVLLSGAALFARSFIRLTGVDLGFVPRQVLVLQVRTLASRYPTLERQRTFLHDLLYRIEHVPGVAQAAATEMLPVTRARRGGAPVTVDGRTAGAITAEPRVISGEYLDAMSIGLLLGRRFDARDATGAPQVAMVNEAFARLAWPGVNPLGRHIRYEGDEQREVVGLVRDVRIFAVDAPPEPQLYIPYTQTWLIPQRLVIRTNGEPAEFIDAIRHEIHEVDPRASAENIQPLTSYVAATIAQPRFQVSLLGIFAGSALLLAIVGVAAVVSYGVARRSRELGIRLALGAQPRDLVLTAMAPSLAAVGVGTIIGVAATLAGGRLVRAFLFEVDPHDPLMLGLAVAVLGATAVAAMWVPARRAARIDPLAALRTE